MYMIEDLTLLVGNENKGHDMIYYQSNAELLEEYNQYVYGHIQAKKTLIALINRSKIRHNQKYNLGVRHEDLIEPSKCLLIGASGTGKTFLVETLQRLVDFPLLILDATQLSPAGSSDGVTLKKVRAAVSSTAEDWVKAGAEKGYTRSFDGAIDQMVVFIDEIDKLANAFESSGNWNKHVQSNFLTLFDHHGEAAGLSFIFAGAFVGLTDKQASKKIGFNHSHYIDKSDILDERVVKYGIIPELVGRLTAIVELDVFKKGDYYRILIEDLIPSKQNDLLYFKNSCIELTQAQIDHIVDKAMHSGQGVRFLKRELDKICLDVEFNYENNYDNKRLSLIDEDDLWGQL